VPNRIFAMVSLAQTHVDCGRFDELEQSCLASLALARLAGHRRFEINGLDQLARVRLRQGRREEAQQHAREAFDVARRIGLGFAGAWLCGLLARVSDGPHELSQALQEGEELLRQRSLAHNHLWFYKDAIEACIAASDWDGALRFADRLEAFVSAEPLPWAVLLAARGRALVGLARDADKPAAMLRLRKVRDDVAAAGLNWALEAIDAKLLAA
jgi:hypothetical protein